MLHRENHSASLCRLNQKPLPLHPSPSAGTMCGDTPECDCTCLRLCCVVCGSGRLKKEGRRRRRRVTKSPESLKLFFLSPEIHSARESPSLLFLARLLFFFPPPALHRLFNSQQFMLVVSGKKRITNNSEWTTINISLL